MILKVLFWFFLGIVIYTYAGYTLLLLIASGLRRLFTAWNTTDETRAEPAVSLLIPSYNEERYVIEKVNNSLELNYPADKLKIIWITDGTNDNTYELLCRYPQMVIMHQHERRGKIHAMNRGVKSVSTPVVIFTDANTMLNPEAIREIIKPFSDPATGCVTGEKRIADKGLQKAAGAGEGLYWRYESFIKKLESDTGSVMGAVGEIFAIRTELYDEVKEDTILDDFTLSLQVLQKGYHIRYAPGAWGTETASLTVSEEMKRKVRIASGGMQSLLRMGELLNPFKYGMTSFKYISHKVLRWTLVPFSFPVIFLLNLAIVLIGKSPVYEAMLGLQCLFYVLALAGKLMENVRTRLGFLFAPYYLLIMNYAVLTGFFKFLRGDYSVKWQKVKRT
ncbi:MAG TPA: glycosyltransferase family 2 protein [Bacteroidales bacterium]|nr:glycosyltransferase family 2 protein [Bacteroidales bacterium]